VCLTARNVSIMKINKDSVLTLVVYGDILY